MRPFPEAGDGVTRIWKLFPSAVDGVTSSQSLFPGAGQFVTVLYLFIRWGSKFNRS
jgi:hypothetical protein